jgi:hypothetical protein
MVDVVPWERGQRGWRRQRRCSVMARAKAMCRLLICVFVLVLLDARSRLAQADGSRGKALNKESANLLLTLESCGTHRRQLWRRLLLVARDA